MHTLDELKQMTIAQLRKYGKEQGIDLPSSLNKPAIIDKIHQVQVSIGDDTDKIGETATTPARKAYIIPDDSDDIPVMTVNAKPKPAPRPQVVSTPSVSVPRPTPPPPKGNKPAFTLQGARAWHNPQPFSTPQQANKFGFQQTQPINTLQGGQQPGADMRAPISKPTAFTRFGPDVQATTVEPAAVLPTVPLVSPEAPQHRYYQPAPRADEFIMAGSKPRDAQNINPAIPELLATGDCGEGVGVLEIHPDGYGFLRAGNFLPSREDVYISSAQIRRFGLRNGDLIEGRTRPMREMDRYSAMLYITKINEEDAEDHPPRRDFTRLTATYPTKKIKLSDGEQENRLLRMLDLFAPIGFGQRALMMLPNQVNSSVLMAELSAVIKKQYPQATTMLLVVDEKPEEIVNIKAKTNCDVLFSTFDEATENHIRLSELTVERAMRVAECGKDVVLLVNDLTAIVRAYNYLMPQGARELMGGLAAGALTKPKRMLGAARNLQEGGSITLIAALKSDQGIAFNTAVITELSINANMVVEFAQNASDKQLTSALMLSKSGTLNADLLLNKEEKELVQKIKALTVDKTDAEATALVLSLLEQSKTNHELASRFDGWMKLMNKQ